MFAKISLRRSQPTVIGLLAALPLLFTACAPVTPVSAPAASTEPRVYFVEPQEGATVTTPVKVVMAAENFVVEPAGEVATEGHGHLHIMVDTPCVAAGQAVPKDETHLHFGKGQIEAELELAKGKHTLCLQAVTGCMWRWRETA